MASTNIYGSENCRSLMPNGERPITIVRIIGEDAEDFDLKEDTFLVDCLGCAALHELPRSDLEQAAKRFGPERSGREIDRALTYVYQRSTRDPQTQIMEIPRDITVSSILDVGVEDA